MQTFVSSDRGHWFRHFFFLFSFFVCLCDDVRSGAFLCNFNALFFLQGDPTQKLNNFAGTPCKSRVTFSFHGMHYIISAVRLELVSTKNRNLLHYHLVDHLWGYFLNKIGLVPICYCYLFHCFDDLYLA